MVPVVALGCQPEAAPNVSYHVCYHRAMAQREKRSVSLPPPVAQAIDQAAAEDGTTFSASLVDTPGQRLRLQAGLRAVAEWEHEQGPLTTEERADGLDRARTLLGRGGPRR